MRRLEVEQFDWWYACATCRPEHGGVSPALSAVVARNIAAERARARWTQADLAERMGVAPSTVSTWEVGKRVVGMDWLPVLCRVFGVPLADLVRGADSDDLRALGL